MNKTILPTPASNKVYLDNAVEVLESLPITSRMEAIQNALTNAANQMAIHKNMMVVAHAWMLHNSTPAKKAEAEAELIKATALYQRYCDDVKAFEAYQKMLTNISEGKPTKARVLHMVKEEDLDGVV